MKNKISNFIYILLIAIPFIYAFYAMSKTGEIVPVHFNLNFTPDRFGSNKSFLTLPAFNLILGIVLSYFTFRNWKTTNKNIYNTTRFAVAFFLGTFSILFIKIAFEYSTNPNQTIDKITVFGLEPSQLLLIAMGLLFVILGNVMPKSERNKYIGVKTPWTVKNDRVWQKTNRLMGMIFMFNGLLTIALAFVKGQPLLILIPVLIAFISLVVSFVYSYNIYKVEV